MVLDNTIDLVLLIEIFNFFMIAWTLSLVREKQGSNNSYNKIPDKQKMSRLKKSSAMDLMLDNSVAAITFWTIFVILMVIVTIKTNSVISIILIILGFTFITVITYVLSKIGDKKLEIAMEQYSK